jgi:hypothetical protein
MACVQKRRGWRRDVDGAARAVLVVVAPVAMSMARTVTEHDREYNPYIDRDRATAPGIR